MTFLLTKKLKYFMTVMDKKCLTTASEELFITRSPLGKAIKELETTLGMTLFTKVHGVLQPTRFALNLHEITEPLYQKIIDIESHIKRLNDERTVNIIIDTHYPDNFIEYLVSILKIKNVSFVWSREALSQNRINEISDYKRDLIITRTKFDTPAQMKSFSLSSSGFLLLVNREIFNAGDIDYEKLARTPLLMKKNTVRVNDEFIANVFSKELGYCPDIKLVDGSVIELLYMTTAGLGVMLMPLKVCETLNIDRRYTIPVYAEGMSMNFYFNANTKGKTLQERIVDIINDIV